MGLKRVKTLSDRKARLELIKEHLAQKKREIEDRIEIAFQEIENLLNSL